MFMNSETLKKAGIELQPSPADAVSILCHPEDGTFFLLVTRKGKLPTEAKKVMCDDIETTIEFIRGFFPPATVPTVTFKNSPENFEVRQEIGFLNKAA